MFNTKYTPLGVLHRSNSLFTLVQTKNIEIMKAKVLFGVKKGQADYKEQLITDKTEHIEKAKVWAKEHGFDRLRVAEIDLSKQFDWGKTVNV